MGPGNIPLLIRILLIPIINMLQIIMRIILKPNRRRRRPLSMFLRDPLLSNTSHLQLLPSPQFTNERAQPLRIRHHRVPNPLVSPLPADDQIARMNMHDVFDGAARVQRECDAAPRAVVLAVAVARVLDVLVAVFRVQWDET